MIEPAGTLPFPVEPSRSIELPLKARLLKKAKPFTFPTKSTEGVPTTGPGPELGVKMPSPTQFAPGA